jgi:hypothetical protein
MLLVLGDRSLKISSSAYIRLEERKTCIASGSHGRCMTDIYQPKETKKALDVMYGRRHMLKRFLTHP